MSVKIFPLTFFFNSELKCEFDKNPPPAPTLTLFNIFYHTFTRFSSSHDFNNIFHLYVSN